MNDVTSKLTLYSEEAIETFLKGDRRDIDRLLLHGLNNLGIVLMEHAEREESLFASMGDAEVIKRRSAWIDSQIDLASVRVKKVEKRTEMMEKVASSTTIWAVIAFLGYLAKLSADALVAWWRTRGHL